MTLSTLIELQARREKLVAAYDTIITGGGVVDVWRDGRRVAYGRGDAGRLQSEIAALDQAIAELDPSLVRPRHHALSVRFSNFR